MTDLKRQIEDFYQDEAFGKFHFEEENHSYYLGGKRLETSVSGITKDFYKPFDAEKKSKSTAKRRGTNQKNIKLEWNANLRRSLRIGNSAHQFGEEYMFNRLIRPKSGYEHAIVKFWSDLPEYIIPVFAELNMYHKTYLFGGTMDILLYNTLTKTFIIADYKTNKDLFKNYKGQKMLKMFSDYLDCPYNKYIIQFSLYQILFEQTGFKVSSRKLIWLKPDGTYLLYDTEDCTKRLRNFLMFKYN